MEKSCLNCDYEEDCRKDKKNLFCESWKPDVEWKEETALQDRLLLYDNLMRDYSPPGLKEWLIEEGFFEKPASLNHHGTYDGALFDHSFMVAKVLESLTRRLELKWQQERSPYIVGMFHDLCKMDTYQKTGGEKWEYHNSPLLTGHGEKSVIMLQQHMRLTDEEMLCIRWHMGAFDTKENWNSYGRSVTNYQNVLWTHTADMVAARILHI